MTVENNNKGLCVGLHELIRLKPFYMYLMKDFYVYILKCADGLYYTGHTDDLDKRMELHRTSECSFTSSRKPLELVYTKGLETREDAKELEYRIKKWSRAKKEALIADDWEKMSELAKKKFDKP